MSTSNDIFLPVGTIIAYGGAITPQTVADLKGKGWLFCNGEKMKATEFESLYAAIGTNFGGDINNNMFNLPDCRGLFLRGVSGSEQTDPDAAGRTAAKPGGNTGNAVGSLQDDALKSHRHTNSHQPDGLHWAVDEANKYHVAKWNESSGDSGETGGSETRPKNLYVNYIIRYRA